MNYPGSLHNHSDYSNLRLRDAINRIESLIDRAIELGQEVIAFTEHESVSNAIKIEKYYNKIKKDNPNFKVIRGNEIYLCRNGLNGESYQRGEDEFYHYILLAKNARGHEQIRELSSRAWSRSFKTGKMIRVPTWYDDLVEVIAQEPGNVIGSSACLGGNLPKKILKFYQNGGTDYNFYNKEIINWCTEMVRLFGKGNFFLELQPASNEEQTIVNKELIKLSKRLDIPYIITCDAHYLRKEDAPIHKAFLTSQEGDREVDDFYESTYLQSTEDVENYLSYLTREELDVAYKNILKIKENCEDYTLLRDLKIPSLKWKIPEVNEVSEYYLEKIPNLKKFVESNFNGDNILAKMVVSKLEKDSRLRTQEIYDEINQNLEVTWISSEVNKTHWSAYFLNLQKIIEVCWDSGTLVGPGRGSGVGFILLYILDIIQINPIWETTKCYSWRFLNPERVSVLDIDTDIEGSKRAQTLAGLRKFYGEDKVANVVTFGTEKSKSAIQTAARGLGIDVDEALYLASLIPADRGQTRTLKECFYGNPDKDFKPIPEFVKAMTSPEYSELWKVAQNIEGLVCRVGEHAGGVIFVDEPFTKSTALMKVPNGDTVTQFDLHDSEDASLIKIDLLSVECLDKIHVCIDLLTQDGYIDKNKSLKEKYEEAIGIYNIERNDKDMWKLVWDHKIQSLFQMEQQSGIQGIALIRPNSVDELAVLNSVIRLMASEKGGEQPLNQWARYRKNINIWLNEMRNYGLNDSEIKWLSKHDAITDGICESQEGLMSLVQEPCLGGNSLTFADKCRKGIAKKQGKLFEECEKTFYENIESQNLSQKLAHYVWDVLLKVQRGYSFNRSHCLAYSLIALQEMNLCFKYPIIYWNTACLTVNSGSLEDNSEEEIVDIYEPEHQELLEGTTFEDLPDRSGKIKKTASTDYAKLAKAIGDTKKLGIKLSLVDINKSDFGFKPDAANNQILYGMKGLLNVSDAVIEEIIKNRPYESPKDFIQRVKVGKQAMVSLIKGGAFDSMMDRKLCMGWYLWETCDKKKRITLQNMGGLSKYNLLPERTEDEINARRIYEFNRYLKAVCKSKNDNEYYHIDNRALNFITEMGYDDLLHSIETLSIKKWDIVYQKWMDVFRKWIADNKDEILESLNMKIFKEEWDKYAAGSISAWEMEALCFYYHDHELAHVNAQKYGLVDFFKLPEDPVVDKTFTRNGKEVNIFKLYKICGTCIAKNKTKSTVSLLTTTGVVTVKFRKEYFSLFDKQISERGSDGVKHVVEKSWFNRGNMIVVMGIRSGDNFVSKKYASSGGHQLYRIDEILENGSLMIRNERYQGDIDE